jgi:hypothetical protein
MVTHHHHEDADKKMKQRAREEEEEEDFCFRSLKKTDPKKNIFKPAGSMYLQIGGGTLGICSCEMWLGDREKSLC